MPFHLTDSIQRYVAISSIGTSTVRGCPSGTLDAARNFLVTIKLRQLGVNQERLFQQRLDRLTKDLRSSLPPKAKYWGLARKILNMFLRDAFYNFYLRRQFGLGRAEPFLEIPLDSAVAKGLRRGTSRGSLPGWPDLKHLKPVDHAMFQQRALKLARQRKTARVHLDTVLWVQER